MIAPPQRLAVRPTRFRPVVAVPARDEEQRLPLLLSALDGQSWCRAGDRLDVVVVLNNGEDDTRGVVERGLARWRNLAIDLVEVRFAAAQAHVGSARRLAMERALALLPDPARGVILTTDADAVPSPDWVSANLRAVEAGADLVGGKLIGNPEEEALLGPGFQQRAKAFLAYADLCDRLASLLDPLDHDPWPRHGDHTGGSLAIRGDLHRDLGGLPPLPFREDLALVSKARAAGARLVHPLDVRVEVSARLAGRAPGGMADCLKAWLRAEAEGVPLLVEDPDVVAARLGLRRAIRSLDRARPAERPAAAARLGIDPTDLFDEEGRFVGGAALVERHAAEPPDGPATVPVDAASVQLSARIAALLPDRKDAAEAA
ncbi:hypothetical protein ASG43_19315 [Aureimonas sp. Leaf454]|uniref:glycosyltransferase n=1 Tax=Aureimonas sp. Leaf454 TaxID=1736381 RepID=UPI0006FF0232|nr:glycosyltransferase family 2 protein [Aureimonas sp. Leaf454]KQT53131.1 hypothetical protein ASG43_19315 [Aureimonas sp. Leaf454]